MHTLASHSRHAVGLWEDEMARLEEKLEVLERVFHEMQSVAVAYSGGVDSSLVLKVAFDTLADGAIALTAVSGSLPAHERDEAKRIARLVGAHWEAIETLETEQPGYIANGPNRCYFCKSTVYEELANWARRAGYRFLVDGIVARLGHTLAYGCRLFLGDARREHTIVALPQPLHDGQYLLGCLVLAEDDFGQSRSKFPVKVQASVLEVLEGQRAKLFDTFVGGDGARADLSQQALELCRVHEWIRESRSYSPTESRRGRE